jgi:Fe-S cluster assembly protein SufD
VAEVMQTNNLYLEEFGQAETELARHGGPALQRLRRAAISRFAEQGFPGPRDEEWRFTPVAPIAAVPFELGGRESEPFRPPSGLPAGVIVCNLAEALDRHADLVLPHLGHYADWKAHAFAALNAAFLRDGAFVYVPRGTVVEQPITFSFRAPASAEPRVWYRRNLVIAETGSQVQLVEEYHGPAGTTYCTNAVTEIVVGEGAVVDHYKVQEEGDAAFHVATMQVHQAGRGHFSSHALTMGGTWVRNEANAVLDAEGCECVLNGLYMGGGQQLIDNHTFIDHAKPHCASHELYKGILAGRARGVFNGKILVRQDAQKTDAKQTNQTLLLSEDAVINTKPQLEIYADDVKCTHGATVGQLSAEAIFYLRSRGVGLVEARNLLTYAFANDVVSRVRVESIRRRLEQALLESRHLPAPGEEEGP